MKYLKCDVNDKGDSNGKNGISKKSGIIFLLITALLWGGYFTAQKIAVENIDIWSFNALRAILGCLILFCPCIAIVDYFKSRKEKKKDKKYSRKVLWIGGGGCGLLIALASIFQQLGIQYTPETSKAGFITAFYIIFVYIFSGDVLTLFRIPHVFWGKHRPMADSSNTSQWIQWIRSFVVFISIVIAFKGLYLLESSQNDIDDLHKQESFYVGNKDLLDNDSSQKDNSSYFKNEHYQNLKDFIYKIKPKSIGIGEAYLFLCAILFSGQILLVNCLATECDIVRLTCVQFFVAGIICLIAMFFIEGMPEISKIKKAVGPILYGGIGAAAAAYTLQVLGQTVINPTIASVIMCLESMFGAIIARMWFGKKEQLTFEQYIGCVLMFIAFMVVAYCTGKENENEDKKKYKDVHEH